MKRLFLPCILMLFLAACGGNTAAGGDGASGTAAPANAPADGEPALAAQADTHDPAEEPQVIPENSPGGYCGNTVTSVQPSGSETRYSFWGDDSVELTDLLLTLDYSGDICRCLPEYTVDTEFGSGYGVNLSEYYARHDGGQAPLTEEQAETIRDIITRNMTEEQPASPE